MCYFIISSSTTCCAFSSKSTTTAYVCCVSRTGVIDYEKTIKLRLSHVVLFPRIGKSAQFLLLVLFFYYRKWVNQPQRWKICHRERSITRFVKHGPYAFTDTAAFQTVQIMKKLSRSSTMTGDLTSKIIKTNPVGLRVTIDPCEIKKNKKYTDFRDR